MYGMSMPNVVVTGAMIGCSMSMPPLVPMPLAVTPSLPAVTAGPPVATVMAILPENIATFGDCTAPGNPACANPTKQGPCKPMIPARWAPGSVTTKIGGMAVLTDDSVCECAYGGVIKVIEAGQEIVQAL